MVPFWAVRTRGFRYPKVRSGGLGPEAENSDLSLRLRWREVLQTAFDLTPIKQAKKPPKH